MEPKPLVTIAVASREDEPRIAACLAQARAQSYPQDRIEIVVADAMSMDATREIVLRVATEDPRVRLIDNPERTRASALNAIVRAAHGDIVVPMDPGGDYGTTHVDKCVEALATSPAEHVAIVPRTAGRTLVERALSAAQQTSLAFASELASEAPKAIAAVKRRVFGTVGLYDPGTRVEEDAELAARIERSGGAVTVRRDIVVHRADASSFKDLFRRHYQLGRSRARTTVRDRRVRSLRTIAPAAIVVGAGALAATSSVQPVTPLAATVYALVTGASAVRVGRSEGLLTIPIVWAAYPVMHLAQGVGFGTGLVRALVKPDWGVLERLSDEPETA
jgi:succinoglycan biosynthesis protein ExoA